MAIDLFQGLNNQTLGFVNVATSAISDNIITGMTGITIIGGAIYITLMGYMIMAGYVQMPLWHFIKSMLRFGFITGLVLFTGAYASEVVPAMEGLQTGIAAMFNGASGGNIFSILDDGIEKAYLLMIHVQQIDRWFFDAANSGLDILFIFLILVSSLLLFGKAASYIIIAQIMFLIMLAIGPLFILMLLFGGITAQWFDRWFGQALTYMLQMALVSLVATIAVQIFSGVMPADPKTINADEYLWVIIQMVGLSFVLYVVIDEASSAAGQLAGGISSGAANLVAAAGGGAAARALAQRSTRLQADGKGSVTRSRLGHLAQGNNALNPAYRQRMKTVRQERHRNQYGSSKNAIKKT